MADDPQHRAPPRPGGPPAEQPTFPKEGATAIFSLKIESWLTDLSADVNQPPPADGLVYYADDPFVPPPPAPLPGPSVAQAPGPPAPPPPAGHAAGLPLLPSEMPATWVRGRTNPFPAPLPIDAQARPPPGAPPPSTRFPAGGQPAPDAGFAPPPSSHPGGFAPQPPSQPGGFAPTPPPAAGAPMWPAPLPVAAAADPRGAPAASAVPPIPALAASAVPPIPALAGGFQPAERPRGGGRLVLAAVLVVALLAMGGGAWFLWGASLRALLNF